MMNDLKAENLKCKGTFAKKLVIIAPVLMLLLAVFSGRYFVENGYNWWYSLIFPGFVTLLSALVNQYEEKGLRYRAVFALPVNLKKTWLSKVTLIGLYVAAAGLIHLGGILLGMTVYVTSSGIAFHRAIAASSILLITSLWQIPLCLFLSKKWGLLPTVFLNLCGGVTLESLTAGKTWWWACPYSWPARLMCPVLGVLPQGVMAKPGDPMLNAGVIPVGVTLSIVLFALLLFLTAQWFPKQEVK